MSYQAVGPLPVPLLFYRTGGANYAMTSAGHVVSFVHRVEHAGTITGLEVRINTVTTAKALRVGIQSVSSGNPSGTWLGATAAGYGTIATPTSAVHKVTFSEGVTVAVGDLIAYVVAWDNNGDPGNLLVTALGFSYLTISGSVANNAYIDNYLTGAWAKASGAGHFGPVYGSTRYPSFLLQAPVTNVTKNIKTSANPDEAGNRIRLPYGGRCVGAIGLVDLDANVAFCLYSDDGTLLATATSYAADRFSDAAAGSIVRWSSPVYLTAGAWYRLTIKSLEDTVTAVTCQQYYEAASLDALELQRDCYYCERQDLGAFADTTTMRAPVSLLIDQIDTGVYNPFAGPLA